jgi:hypothetical protein
VRYIFRIDLHVSLRHVLLDDLVDHLNVPPGIRANICQDGPILLLPQHLLHVLDVHLHHSALLVGQSLLNIRGGTIAMRYLSLPQRE